jgi:hypothetical protein
MNSSLPEEFREKIIAALVTLDPMISREAALEFFIGALSMLASQTNLHVREYSNEEIASMCRMILDSAQSSPSGAACVLLALLYLDYEEDQRKCSSRLITSTLGKSSTKVAGTSGTLKDLESQGQVRSEQVTDPHEPETKNITEKKKASYVYWLTEAGEAEARKVAVKHQVLKSAGIEP